MKRMLLLTIAPVIVFPASRQPLYRLYLFLGTNVLEAISYPDDSFNVTFTNLQSTQLFKLAFNNPVYAKNAFENSRTAKK